MVHGISALCPVIIIMELGPIIHAARGSLGHHYYYYGHAVKPTFNRTHSVYRAKLTFIAALSLVDSTAYGAVGVSKHNTNTMIGLRAPIHPSTMGQMHKQNVIPNRCRQARIAKSQTIAAIATNTPNHVPNFVCSIHIPKKTFLFLPGNVDFKFLSGPTNCWLSTARVPCARVFSPMGFSAIQMVVPKNVVVVRLLACLAM